MRLSCQQRYFSPLIVKGANLLTEPRWFLRPLGVVQGTCGAVTFMYEFLDAFQAVSLEDFGLNGRAGQRVSIRNNFMTVQSSDFSSLP